jgi:hypothetical protein
MRRKIQALCMLEKPRNGRKTQTAMEPVVELRIEMDLARR